MIRHTDLPAGFAGWRQLRQRIFTGEISLGGNRNLKIYGGVQCRSGRRLKRENRVFFRDAADALANDYRPCAHCLPDAYRVWKQRQVQ